MTDPYRRTLGDSSLIDLLDRLVETGVVATGDVLLGLADVDLIRVNLQLVLGAIDTLQADSPPAGDPPHAPLADDNPHAPPADDNPHAPPADAGPPATRTAAGKPTGTGSAASTTVRTPARAGSAPGPVPPLRLEPTDRSDLGIGGLLVAVIEIVHRLLERQAIHRMEHGSLTSDQVERLGQALMALDQRVEQLIQLFSPRSTPALPVTVAGAAH